MTPKQWYIYSVNLEPRVSTKPGKQRPCVAIQHEVFGDNGLDSTVILPITSNVKKGAFPLRIRIPKGTTDLTEESDVMIDQILSWDNTLFAKEIGPLPSALVLEIKLALVNFLDLE